jgi:hypothetical protein
MCYGSLHVAEETMHQRGEEAVHRALLRSMAREARIEQHGWPYRGSGRMSSPKRATCGDVGRVGMHGCVAG